MEEEKKDEQVEDFDAQESTDQQIQRIKLKRHYWPDELEMMQLKKRVNRSRFLIALTAVVMIAAGWLLGTMWPIGGRYSSITNTAMDSTDKFQAILSILENDWFFKDDIEDIDTTLTDKALYGMTDNDIDAHTSYMSKEELDSFQQNINRNFVGIGVQFYTNEGVHMISKVYKNSPADEAGVQAGDIIHAVDGTIVDDMTANEVKEICSGEEGTDVTIEFLRQGKSVTLKITRGEVNATAYGEVRDSIGYLELYQFGDSTAEEVITYLDEFKEAGITDIILDLRDNGGGYVDSLQNVASCFLPEGDVVLTQIYSDGSETPTKTKSGQYTNIEKIVILVNENTASAAEAMTLALKENRPEDVTVVGTTTYGKGTAQVTKTFDDGSALKYTTSKWVSPDGNWINGIGITPDESVKLHDVFYRSFAGMEEEEEYSYDSVSDAISDMQLCLNYLGYDVDRTDGYFSKSTEDAIVSFETDHELESSTTLTKTIYDAIRSAVSLRWNSTTDTDTQYAKALEILNG